MNAPVISSATPSPPMVAHDAVSPESPSTSYGTQRTLNGEVHDWYRIILGFPDHLVGMLIDTLRIKAGDSVLDPYCGSGTTLVECMKRNVECFGVEANPACVFATRVKTNWDIRSHRLLECLDEMEVFYKKEVRRVVAYKEDPAYEYLDQAGMLDRGWISAEPLRKSISIKNAIAQVRTSTHYQNALRLALLSEVVHGASNVKFGPQLYCSTAKADVDVLSGFQIRVRQIAKDLDVVSGLEHSRAQVRCGDSRNLRPILPSKPRRLFDAVICSPPYPAEHDYTRHTRLELAFLELVRDNDSLRSIKRNMIRSHTKGIYKSDAEGVAVKDHHLIAPLVKEIELRARTKTYGFARLYGKATLEYFGGMRRHLVSVHSLLRPNGKCAYVVGDQTSYLQVHIPTAEILASLAEEVGFDVVGIDRWRGRWSTATSRIVDENILILARSQDPSAHLRNGNAMPPGVRA
jgi:DNA modification methylase